MPFVIEEVGLREGLQSNDIALPLSEKIRLVDMILESGIRRVQLGSFVNEKRVPQMAGVEDLFERFGDRGGEFSALALNMRGLERAVKVGVRLINISISASDSHNRENTGKSINEGLPIVLDMIRAAKSHGMKVRAGVQAAFGCYIEGRVDEDRIMDIVSRFHEADADEIGLSDTAGFAVAGQVKRVVSSTMAAAPGCAVGIHLHDTFGMGLANTMAAYEAGVSVFDSSIAGMGGCPFMPGAPGNIPTEDMAVMAESLGWIRGISVKKLVEAAGHARSLFAKDFTGKISAHAPLIQKLGLTELIHE